MLVFTDATQRDMSDDIITSTTGGTVGSMAVAWVGLGTGTPVLSGSTAISDLDEATYTGYARQGPIVWGPEFDNPDGLKSHLSGLISFIPSDGVTPNTITNIWLATAKTSGALLGAELLAQAVPLIDATSALHTVVELGVGQGIVQGHCQIIV